MMMTTLRDESSSSKPKKVVGKLHISRSLDINDKNLTRSTEKFTGKTLSIINNNENSDTTSNADSGITNSSSKLDRPKSKYSSNIQIKKNTDINEERFNSLDNDSTNSFEIKLKNDSVVPILILAKDKKYYNPYKEKLESKSKINYIQTIQKYELKNGIPRKATAVNNKNNTDNDNYYNGNELLTHRSQKSHHVLYNKNQVSSF